MFNWSPPSRITSGWFMARPGTSRSFGIIHQCQENDRTQLLIHEDPLDLVRPHARTHRTPFRRLHFDGTRLPPFYWWMTINEKKNKRHVPEKEQNRLLTRDYHPVLPSLAERRRFGGFWTVMSYFKLIVFGNFIFLTRWLRLVAAD